MRTRTNLEEKYLIQLKKLLEDKNINNYNRKLFADFLNWQKDKLEHGSNNGRLEEGNFKTLGKYIGMLRNVEKWFNHKEWNTLTEDDIREVRRDLLDGTIVNKQGKKYTDIRSYVNKIFKYKPFTLAGLTDAVNNVFEFAIKTQKKQVRYLAPSSVKKMIMAAKSYQHKALFCLAWDIGENIDSLLQLRWKWVKEFTDKETGKRKYNVYLPDEILKESRTSRTEVTLFDETVDALDKLREIGKTTQKRGKDGLFTGEYNTVPFEDDDLLFNFQYARAKDLFNKYVKDTGVKCEPNKESPTWKDFRSGMACNLFDLGWTAEDVNMRLGHSALSKQFDVYVNYKGLNRKNAVRKYDKLTLKIVEEKLEEAEAARDRQEMRHRKELEKQGGEIKNLQSQVTQIGSTLKMINKGVKK